MFDATEKMQQLKIHCKQLIGNFGLLWHRYDFQDDVGEMYQSIMGGH